VKFRRKPDQSLGRKGDEKRKEEGWEKGTRNHRVLPWALEALPVLGVKGFLKKSVEKLRDPDARFKCGGKGVLFPFLSRKALQRGKGSEKERDDSGKGMADDMIGTKFL